MMDVGKIERRVAQLHANARNGTLRLDEQIYALTFDGHNYVTTDAAGDHVATFNTRQITVARKWLREYVAG